MRFSNPLLSFKGNSEVIPYKGNIPRSLKRHSLKELLTADLPEREMLLSPWLPKQGLTMIFAPCGVGKTHVSLGIACAVASGTSFLKWHAPKPRRVLFVDGEMPANVLQERLKQIVTGIEGPPNDDAIQFICSDLEKDGIPDLASIEGQLAIEEQIDDIDLLIFDNLSTLVYSGKENEAESWAPIQQWILKLRARGKSVLFIHHSGKSGQQRGTSRREDALDTVISLSRPSDYTPEMGACFEVQYKKSRGIHGDDVAPFIAHLVTNDDDAQSWECESSEESLLEKILILDKEGISQSEIAQELNVNKSTISRQMKKARELGRL